MFGCCGYRTKREDIDAPPAPSRCLMFFLREQPSDVSAGSIRSVKPVIVEDSNSSYDSRYRLLELAIHHGEMEKALRRVPLFGIFHFFLFIVDTLLSFFLPPKTQ